MLTDDITIEEIAAIRYNEGREDGWEGGLEKGREEGWEGGLERGREEGWEGGREEGKTEGRNEVFELMAQGFSIDEIRQRLTQTTSN